ncbi:MAG: tetratricopeptide repeat protein [Pirellulales bacterium]|nr:tetratricopeptide repeat protein [Pirellulales bacterium]
MIIIRVFSAIAAVLLAAAAQGLDSIKTVNGTSVSGKIVQMNWDKVTIEQGLGGHKTTKEVPTNQIVTIFFDGGSATVKKALNGAKTEIAGKREYAEGLKFLAKIDPAEIDSDILKQEYDYYAALANGKLALSGVGKIEDAGKAMFDFVKNNPESYHYLEANEALGDLLAGVRSFAKAEEYYGKLAQAPWPDVKMKAGVLIGRAQLAQGKFAEAEKTFQSVLGAEAEGPLAERQRTIALLGKASSLTGQKKTPEAIVILSGVIEKATRGDADGEDAELLSRAYNALGTAYRQLGDLDEAKFAFLRTDLLYASVPDTHAEALANLAEIWEQLHRPERAVEARKTLDKLYKNSAWAKGESVQ